MASFASTAVLPTCGAGCGAQRGSRCVARASLVATPAPATARTHYEVLGVGAGASRCEIKAAYRRLAREVHPDAGGRGDEGFIRLHAAYATLADPRSSRATTAPWPSPRRSGAGRRRRGSGSGGGRRTSAGSGSSSIAPPPRHVAAPAAELPERSRWSVWSVPRASCDRRAHIEDGPRGSGPQELDRGLYGPEASSASRARAGAEDDACRGSRLGDDASLSSRTSCHDSCTKRHF